MRRENKSALCQPQMLSDFRRVPVREQAVRAKILVHLNEMRLALWLFSRAAYARFAITNDPARRIDPVGFDERPQSENHRRRVAAGIRNEPRRGQRLRIQLWKPVHGLLQNFSCGWREV